MTCCPPAPCPSLEGFQSFVANIMGVPSAAMPSADFLNTVLCVAIDIVNPAIRIIPQQYTWAVYNLAGDRLINYAPDNAGQTFFADIRGKAGFNITAFVPGVVSAASDVSTGDSLLNPDFMKNLTLGDLQDLKTPYGRAYLAIAQDYGPAPWGLTN